MKKRIATFALVMALALPLTAAALVSEEGVQGRESAPIQPAVVEVGAKEAETKERIFEKFGVDLSEWSYVSFVALCQQDLPPEHKPLASIIMDLMAMAQEGDSLPLGVLYQDGYAYTLHGEADGTWQLTKYCVDSDAVANFSAQSEEFVANWDGFDIFLDDYAVVDVLVSRQQQG